MRMHNRREYLILGLMSGSSLDGLDMALCRFTWEADGLSGWALLESVTIPFPAAWKAELEGAPQLSGEALTALDRRFGCWLGDQAAAACERWQVVPDLIASHGHTVFHRPDRGYTLQIGEGAALAARSGIPVACNFRDLDLARGGQGTPIAPLADRYLFPGFDGYLNLGGIANITLWEGDALRAFDICGANQLLNGLSRLAGMPFDAHGQMARSGHLIPALFTELNQLPFFRQPFPKSLSNQWVRQYPLALLLEAPASIADRLHTACRHIGRQISLTLARFPGFPDTEREKRILVSGGGVHNQFLLECIREECEKFRSLEFVVPENAFADFKEAALMALMGLFRLLRRPNTFQSVTGARADSIGGVIHLP